MANNSNGETSDPTENRYSCAFQEASISSLPFDVRRAIDLLRQHRDAGVYSVSRAERRGRLQIIVGVTISIGPYLPPRCDPAEEGMCSPEPVLFVFDEERYPDRAPSVGSDRKDFSWAGKPHVSQPREEWPPFFCLTRASLDDWFAEYGFAAYFDRVARWLIDAAQGQLQREDGRFEPTLVISRLRYLFDYEETADWIKNRRDISERADFHFGEFTFLEEPESSRESALDQGAIRFDRPRRFGKIEPYILNPETDEEGLNLGGIIAWTPEGVQVTDHFSKLPHNRDQLLEWAEDLQIPLSEPLRKLIDQWENSADGTVLIPILLGIQRPTQLFGVESALEILSLFYMRGDDGKDEVIFARHQHLLTPSRAQRLSNTDSLSATVTLVGAGALGSKLFSHWYRGGGVDWTILDPDVLAPHNMVRHALQPQSVGRYKASELSEAFDEMYSTAANTSKDIQIEEKSFRSALRDQAIRHRVENSIVVDTTGSPTAMQELTGPNVPQVATTARASIVDEGRKAALLMEGADRNPRIDDLRAALYHLGVSSEVISEWLRRRSEQENEQAGLQGEEVEVGLNCASDTFRLADDEVSLHAAQLSMRLRNWLGAHHGPAAATRPPPQETQNTNHSDSEEQAEGLSGGRVGLSDAGTGWHEWQVPKVTTVRATGWEIRVAGQAVSKMEELMHEYHPSETGGIALGRINRNRQTLYVTDALPPPPDSKHSPSCFVRGKKGVRKATKTAERRTGSTIGYAAEWHTHPRGPSSLSIRDFETACDTRQKFRGSFFPAVILVLAPSGLIAHVKDPLSR